MKAPLLFGSWYPSPLGSSSFNRGTMRLLYLIYLSLCASYAFAVVPLATPTQTFAQALVASPTSNPVSALAAGETFRTISTTTTKTVVLTSRKIRASRVTGVVVNDGPAPTIVYNCNNMADICYNTQKISRYKQSEGLYLLSYDGSTDRNRERRKVACKARGLYLRMNGCSE